VPSSLVKVTVPVQFAATVYFPVREEVTIMPLVLFVDVPVMPPFPLAVIWSTL
jgi:hypothetical protein